MITSTQIEQRLIFDHYARATVMPCFTPFKWFECDVAEITTAGYLVEYEIKVSRGDFKADARKADGCIYRPGHPRYVAPVTKHQRLAAHDPLGPTRFYFVTPAGLLTEAEIPPWAGWMEAREARGCFAGCVVNERRPATRLHGQKARDGLVSVRDSV